MDEMRSRSPPPPGPLAFFKLISVRMAELFPMP